MLTCSSSSSKVPSCPQNFQSTLQKILHNHMNFTASSSAAGATGDLPANRPSPRQLQGPRPTPLKVSKDSYKISKKPPAAPQNHNPAQPQQHPPPRPPVIIYTVSPKIIHTNPADFMTLVQRLTGPNSGDPSAASHSPSAGALSPAARFAAIETADKPSPRNNYKIANQEDNNIIEDLLDGGGEMQLDRPTSMPGILSPVPSSLQPISSRFFSPISSFDPGYLSFLNDLSPGPAFGGGGSGGGGGGGFLISPGSNSNLLSTPMIPSPGSYWDLFGGGGGGDL